MVSESAFTEVYDGVAYNLEIDILFPIIISTVYGAFTNYRTGVYPIAYHVGGLSDHRCKWDDYLFIEGISSMEFVENQILLQIQSQRCRS